MPLTLGQAPSYSEFQPLGSTGGMPSRGGVVTGPVLGSYRTPVAGSGSYTAPVGTPPSYTASRAAPVGSSSYAQPAATVAQPASNPYQRMPAPGAGSYGGANYYPPSQLPQNIQSNPAVDYWNKYASTVNNRPQMSGYKTNPDGTVSYSLSNNPGNYYTVSPTYFNSMIGSMGTQVSGAKAGPNYTGPQQPMTAASTGYAGSVGSPPPQSYPPQGQYQYRPGPGAGQYQNPQGQYQYPQGQQGMTFDQYVNSMTPEQYQANLKKYPVGYDPGFNTQTPEYLQWWKDVGAYESRQPANPNMEAIAQYLPQILQMLGNRVGGGGYQTPQYVGVGGNQSRYPVVGASSYMQPYGTPNYYGY